MMASRYGNETNMYGLRADQLFEIQTAFHQIDSNHNGYITSAEMRDCFQRLNIRYSEEDIQRVLLNMDFNRDGQVSYDEYMAFMAKVYRGDFV
jgi:Ca2+-binding EF-hand superfamily protein